MRELKDDLASLRIDRDAPRRSRWRVPLILLILVALGVAGWYYFGKARTVFGAVEVETVQSSLQTGSGPNAGTPILTGTQLAFGAVPATVIQGSAINPAVVA